MLGRSKKKAAVHELRTYARSRIGAQAALSWTMDGLPRTASGKCLDISEGGISIEVDEVLPASTRLHVSVPELFTEADGIVRHSGQGCIGVEFTWLLYSGPSSGKHRDHVRPVDHEAYMMVGLAAVLVLFALGSVPGLMPNWVPFAARPSGPVTPPPPFFTLGSSRASVYAAQGPPTRITETTWHYGSSRVFFRGDRVAGWSASPGAPLRNDVSRAEPKGSDRKPFTVGATAAEVLAVEGPPDDLTDEVWRYGDSEVYFKDGRVVRWNSAPGRPLKAASGKRPATSQPGLADGKSPTDVP